MKKLISILFVTNLLLQIAVFTPNQVYGESVPPLFIKINLWTNQLLVIKNNKIYRTYSISPGTDKSPTPIGTFKVVQKNKSWGGGFGSRWLGLNVPWGQYGIHGTNKPMLIGKNVSSGCIRMRNKDVEALFEIIPEGTKVYIIGPITGKGRGAFKNLSVGSRGNLVQLVQQRLKLSGLYEGKTDGIYGRSTALAVRKFQKLNNLPVNGGVREHEYRLLGLME